MSNTVMDIAKAAAIIEAKGLRKKWIAEEMKIHPKTLYSYLSGRTKPSPAMVKLLAFVIGVPDTDLKAS